MPTTKQALRILTYNVKMLPGPFGRGTPIWRGSR